MISLNPSISQSVNKWATEPIYYVQIDFDSPVRLTTGPLSTWDGSTWSDIGLKVSGISWNGSAGKRGSISIQNSTAWFSDLCLTQQVRGRQVHVWGAWDHLSTRATDAAILYAQLEAGSAEIAPDLSAVNVQVSSQSYRRSFTPRIEISRSYGFSRVPPKERIFLINGETYRLSRED